jgi:SAM-dependent methyltransferase
LRSSPRCYFDGEDFVDSLPHRGKGTFLLGQLPDGEVYECSDCGLVFSPKQDKAEYLKIYTDPGRYFDVSVSVGYNSFEDRYEHDYAVSEPRLRNLTQRMNGEKTALDVGCGNCALISRLRQIGLNAFGVDLDSFSANRGMQMIGGAEIQIGDYLELKFPHTFDVILFTDSFEHFLYPSSYVQRTAGLISPGGLVVIEMPDSDCDDYRRDKLHWRHIKPKEHPFLYQQHHIEALFESHGFKVVDAVYTIPGRVIYYLRASDADHSHS